MVGRRGQYLTVVDSEGQRHLLRVGAIQMLSDQDACQDTTIITVAGRSLFVPVPLDKMVALLPGAY